MALNPIEITGTVNRATDIYQMRNQHENKMHADTSFNLANVDKNVEDKSTKVIRSDDADMFNQKFDAKDKGKNQYFNNRKKKSSEDESDGKVIVKKKGGFDISI